MNLGKKFHIGTSMPVSGNVAGRLCSPNEGKTRFWHHFFLVAVEALKKWDGGLAPSRKGLGRGLTPSLVLGVWGFTPGKFFENTCAYLLILGVNSQPHTSYQLKHFQFQLSPPRRLRLQTVPLTQTSGNYLDLVVEQCNRKCTSRCLI